MKVLMLSEYPYTESEQGHGGIIQATYQLVEGFKALNLPEIELHVVTTSLACKRIEVRRNGNVFCHFIPRAESMMANMSLTPMRLLLYVRHLSTKLRPDLIHGQGTVTYLVLSLLLGRKSIQTVHGIYRNEQAAIPKDQQTLLVRLKFALKVYLENAYLRRIRNLIAITSQIVQLMDSQGNNDVRVFNINNAIDQAFFDMAQKRAMRQESSGEVKLLFVAAITPRKGLHVLIEAFKRLSAHRSNLKLSVVGIWNWAPQYVEEQVDACRELQTQGKIEFTGGVSRDRLIRAFEEADIFVLPSFSESAPMVISQAMCVGLPIVTTRVGGIPEMIEQGATGVMLEPGNVDDLTAELARLADDAELRDSLGTAAREVGFRRYHPISIARATLTAYQAVIAN